MNPMKGGGLSNGRQLSAEVREAVLSRESAMYVILTLQFHNRGDRTVHIRCYRITWSGGHFESSPKDLEVPGSSTREWIVRVTPASGDLDSLLVNPSGAVVDVR
jgi:hypothetical protein